MVSKATGPRNFRMSWCHSELQSMSQQVTHLRLLFLVKQSTFPLISSSLRQSNGTRPTCIGLSNKNLQTCTEFTEQHALIFKLLNCSAMLCIILKRMAPDISQVTMFSYRALSPPKDWIPNIHPHGNVHTQFCSGLATSHIKSKTQRSNKRPSFILTA